MLIAITVSLIPLSSFPVYNQNHPESMFPRFHGFIPSESPLSQQREPYIIMYARKSIFNIYAVIIAYKCRKIGLRIRLRLSSLFS